MGKQNSMIGGNFMHGNESWKSFTVLWLNHIAHNFHISKSSKLLDESSAPKFPEIPVIY